MAFSIRFPHGPSRKCQGEPPIVQRILVGPAKDCIEHGQRQRSCECRRDDAALGGWAETSLEGWARNSQPMSALCPSLQPPTALDCVETASVSPGESYLVMLRQRLR